METKPSPPSISVIFVTNRRGWEPILADDLERQTFQDFEVIVADDLFDDHQAKYLKQFKPRQKNPDDVWNLNKAYNDAIEKADGELLVFLQDFIWIPDDGLEKFWTMYQKHPLAIVTGVGNKAKTGLEGVSEPDSRMIGSKMPEEVNHTYWELNWASCPRDLMCSFNEEMDRFYGGENQYVAKKINRLGVKILIDRTNICIAYSQAHCGGRPANWEIMHANKEGRLAKFLDELSPT